MEKEFPILYLAGPEDMDRHVAISKGVPNSNLIAIDRDERNALYVRNGRNPVILGSALHVLKAWPDTRGVCAVMLDLCSGFTQENAQLIDAVHRRPFKGSVVMINMLRGRDQWSNPIRRSFAEFPVHELVSQLLTPHVSPSHRGLQMLATYAYVTLGKLYEYGGLERSENNAVRNFLSILWMLKPVFVSYKSGPQVFDTVVFEPWAGDMSATPCLRETAPMRRKLSAMLAVRTSRMAS